MTPSASEVFEDPGPVNEGHNAEFLGVGDEPPSRDFQVFWAASTGTMTTWHHLPPSPSQVPLDGRVEVWFSWLDEGLLVAWHDYETDEHGSFTSRDPQYLQGVSSGFDPRENASFWLQLWDLVTKTTHIL